MGNKVSTKFLSTMTALILCSVAPLSSNVYAEDGAVQFKVSTAEGVVGDDVRIDVTSNTNIEFVTGTFCLHYDNQIVNYKGFELPSSSAINPGDITVSSDEQGVTYILISINSVTNANISFDFSVIAEGTTDMTLDITGLFNESNEEVKYEIENGIIAAKPTVTEPPITTEPVTTTTEQVTTTTEPVTTTSEQVTTTTESVTTTTEPVTTTEYVITTTVSESDVITTTTGDSSSADPATTTLDSDKPISNSTTTTKPATTSLTNNSTTTKSNNSGSNTTKSATTTTANVNGAVNTGDTFPAVALTIALSASAAVAFVTKCSNKE